MSEIGLFWLLLPLAALSGWAVTRFSHHFRKGGRITDLSSTYFRGLNYLLNEQPDKAIEVFLKIAEIDSETAETHLALGNLFRRRGEVDRAIRIHQNLVARSTLSPEQRSYALLELSEDYMRAGLFDRAESLFQELVGLGSHVEPSLRQLVAIYEQEKDWDKAIEAARALGKASGQDMAPVVGQYYCELAENARESGNEKQAREFLNKAARTDPGCARASIILGEMESEKGEYRAAIEAFRQIEDQDIDYLPEVLENMLDCYERDGRDESAEGWLRDVVDKYDGISPLLALADMIRQREGENEAAAFLTEQLRKRPSVRGLDHLIEVTMREGTPEARDNMLILRDLTSQLLEDQAIYRCGQCGFAGRVPHWQCPSCKNWGSVKSIKGVAGE